MYIYYLLVGKYNVFCIFLGAKWVDKHYSSYSNLYIYRRSVFCLRKVKNVHNAGGKLQVYEFASESWTGYSEILFLIEVILITNN